MIKVMKFGGTSVGSPERMKEVARIVTQDGKPTFVVLSAMSGTTNSLVEIADTLYQKRSEQACQLIDQLEQKYAAHVDQLLGTDEKRTALRQFLSEEFSYLRSFTNDMFTSFEEKAIVAQGEIISTHMVVAYLQEQGFDAVLLNALDFMRTDKNGEPNAPAIRQFLADVMEAEGWHQVYITQGFICRNAFGEIDNLQRGGSDYTASLVGEALDAEEIQIWTDIDGLHNNDPRVVDHTEPVRQLNFGEAAELAYFGAKILHPTCIQPAKRAGIPVRLKFTMDPEAEGTLITSELAHGVMKAVAAKDHITAIKIRSSRMLLPTGFLRKVFEIFESYQTPVDMVATSEVGVSVTIADDKYLSEIVAELEKYGRVIVDRDMCIVCVVGDLNWENVGFETLAIDALRNIPVRMISFGGSNHNISLLIKGEDKKRALQQLSDKLFNIDH